MSWKEGPLRIFVVNQELENVEQAAQVFGTFTKQKRRLGPGRRTVPGKPGKSDHELPWPILQSLLANNMSLELRNKLITWVIF